MSNLIKGNAIKQQGIDGVIGFLNKAIKFAKTPYTIEEKCKKEEETKAILSATQRIVDETQKIKAETGFEKATTGYVKEFGQYGQEIGKRLVTVNEQKAALLGVAGDVRESEVEVFNAQGKYEQRKAQARLAARTKNHVFS